MSFVKYLLILIGIEKKFQPGCLDVMPAKYVMVFFNESLEDAPDLAGIGSK